MLLGTRSRGQALEGETEAHSGEPPAPGHTARWGKELGFACKPVELQSPHAGPGRKAKDSRRRVRLAGVPQTRERGFGDGELPAGLSSALLLPHPTWSLEFWAGIVFARQCFAISARPWEASGSQTGLSSPVSPGQSTGQGARARVTQTQVQILPLLPTSAMTSGKVIPLSEPFCPSWVFLLNLRYEGPRYPIPRFKIRCPYGQGGLLLGFMYSLQPSPSLPTSFPSVRCVFNFFFLFLL